MIIASDENLKAETGKAEKLTRFIAESGVQGLKARKMTAQGNALGNRSQYILSPERAAEY
jgi:hypothetical protein